MKNLLTLSATLLIGVLLGMQCEKYLRKRDSIRQSRRELDSTVTEQAPGSHKGFAEYALRMGIFARPIDAYTKKRLALQHDKGFVVHGLQKRGPAMEAGIRRRDIISKI